MPKKKQYSGEELMGMRDQLRLDTDMFQSLRETCRFFFKPQDKTSYTFGNNVAGKQMPQNPIGIEAARDLTAGLFSNTINLSDEFFGYKIADKELSEDDEVKDWFAKCSEIAISRLAASNYGLSTLETIHDYVVVCTGVQYSEMTGDKGLRFQNFMIDHCGIAEDKDGRVDTVFRDFEMTAHQAYEKWNDKCPDTVKVQYLEVEDRYKKSRYVHCVFPRLDYEKKYLKNGEEAPERPEDMKWASYYLFEADKEIIEIGGYDSCPYSVPRFEKNYDNPHGRGVSFTCKGIASSLEILDADIEDGIELKVNPPTFLPPGISDLSDIDITPGAVNFYNPTMGLPIFYQADIDLPNATAREEKKENQIQEMFYVNLFRMLDDRKNMTATEVAQRVAEKIQMILPIVARLYDELYSVSLTRVFYLLLKGGFFPDMPEELKEAWGEQELRVSYTTKLDMKLAQLEIGQIMKSLEENGVLLGMAAQFPDINGSLKVTEFSKEIFRLNGVSPDYIPTDEESEEFFAAKAEAEAKAAQMQQQTDMLDKINLQETVDDNSILGQQEGMLSGTTGAGII